MKKRIIMGLETFLCEVTNCWITERGCAINQDIARMAIRLLSKGMPIWALEEHLANRMIECSQCQKPKINKKFVDDTIKEEISSLVGEIESLISWEDEDNEEVRKSVAEKMREAKRRWKASYNERIRR